MNPKSTKPKLPNPKPMNLHRTKKLRNLKLNPKTVNHKPENKETSTYLFRYVRLLPLKPKAVSTVFGLEIFLRKYSHILSLVKSPIHQHQDWNLYSIDVHSLFPMYLYTYLNF